jgi:hypothetical protein
MGLSNRSATPRATSTGGKSQRTTSCPFNEHSSPAGVIERHPCHAKKDSGLFLLTTFVSDALSRVLFVEIAGFPRQLGPANQRDRRPDAAAAELIRPPRQQQQTSNPAQRVPEKKWKH